MSILKRLYASAGQEIIHETLEISDGVTTFWLTKGWDDITATLETGQTVTFTACGMDVALPARNADGTQDLKFALCNIAGDVSAFLRDMLAGGRKAHILYRSFVSSDLGAPAEPPHWFEVKGGQWTATQADITAGYFNLLETAWPRRIYNLNDFPGLRYIA